MADQGQVYYEEVATFALAGLSGDQLEEGRTLIEAIVDDWVEQADDSDLDGVVEIGREDLEELLEGQDPQERLQTLRHLVLERKVEKLSTSSLRLAYQVANGETDATAANGEARMIGEAVIVLRPAVQSLEDAELKRRLSRKLADADLESRFVLDGGEGIMSIRLNHMLS